WMGVRFQLLPLGPYNDIMMHVRMLDVTAVLQQEALGIIGVNLLYGTFIYSNDYKAFVESLADNLGTTRIEVDMLTFSGPDFKDYDNRIISLQLVEQGLTNAVMFNPEGLILQPSEALYKKVILVERGSFRPLTNINIDMLNCAESQLIQEPQVIDEKIVILLEITIKNLLAEGFDLADFLARVDIISALGYNVLISNYPEYYKLSAYFRRYTQKMIGIALGINHLMAIFDDQYYNTLEGGILEACGRLFKDNVKLYVYPMHAKAFKHYRELLEAANGTKLIEDGEHGETDESTKGVLITADNVKLKPHIRHLYEYLKENGYIEAIQGFNPKNLDIFSRDILKLIREGAPGWEEAIPKKVADIIKEKKLFLKNGDGNH
ncbi:MAG: nicotinate-nucleotide adenylyltransferase, partial [Verrucomicrobia bacterium]